MKIKLGSLNSFFIIIFILIVIYYFYSKKEHYTDEELKDILKDVNDIDLYNQKKDILGVKGESGFLTPIYDPTKIYLYIIDKDNNITDQIGYYTNDKNDIDFENNIDFSHEKFNKKIKTYFIKYPPAKPMLVIPSFTQTIKELPKGISITMNNKFIVINENIFKEKYYFSSFPKKK